MKFVKIVAATTIAITVTFVTFVAVTVRNILKQEDEAEPYEWYDWDDEEDHDPPKGTSTESDAKVIDLRGRSYKFNPQTKTYQIIKEPT
jgi:hypothetical protein